MTGQKHPSFDEKLDYARSRLAASGHAGARIAETTPLNGGLRARVVQMLVDSGEAEWIEPGVVARLKCDDFSAQLAEVPLTQQQHERIQRAKLSSQHNKGE